MCDLSKPMFHNDDAARRYLERIRWPDGVVCPYCGQLEAARPVRGKSMGKGWYYCSDCERKFTVRVGTVYERSHIPLHKWVMAMHLMAASKKGISAHQLHRMLGITYKSAWFMAHRIREAMVDANPQPMGGPGGSVQADETYIGKKEAIRTKTAFGLPFTKSGNSGPGGKRAVVSLVSGGKARTFHVKSASAVTVREILITNVKRETELHTDESPIYTRVGREYAAHMTVKHSANQYVGPSGESTNKCENYFSIFKRGMKGVYQHCAEKHLQRYINEFDFRYNRREITDAERATEVVTGAGGKLLSYRRTGYGANVQA